ncbi:Dynamin-related protein DNM1, partial [Zancudomyces culisetae]
MVEGTWPEMSTSELTGGARLYHIFHHIFSVGLEGINPASNLTDEDIRTAIRNSSGPRASLFVPELAFQLLIKPLIKSLEHPSQRCVQMAYEELGQIAQRSESKELKRYPKLHRGVMRVVSELLRERVGPTSTYVESLIAIEQAYINTNHPDFIGGSGALIELQKKAEIKRRQNARAAAVAAMQSATNAASGSGAWDDDDDGDGDGDGDG